MIGLNIKPYCTCYATGTWQKQDGYSYDPPSGLWVHGRCRKPSKMNYEREILGIKPLKHNSIFDDIWATERFYEAKKEIEAELDWDIDDKDDDE